MRCVQFWTRDVHISVPVSAVAPFPPLETELLPIGGGPRGQDHARLRRPHRQGRPPRRRRRRGGRRRHREGGRHRGENLREGVVSRRVLLPQRGRGDGGCAGCGSGGCGCADGCGGGCASGCAAGLQQPACHHLPGRVLRQQRLHPLPPDIGARPIWGKARLMIQQTGSEQKH
jgi:hypothetical protein